MKYMIVAALLSIQFTSSLAFSPGNHEPRSATSSATAPASCPAHLSRHEAPPPGWQSYYGPTMWFHCGFRGILENRLPTRDAPQSECFYDELGQLIDEHHPDAACRGTANDHDARTDTWAHFRHDRGGVVKSGLAAFIASRWRELRELRILSLSPGMAGARVMARQMAAISASRGTTNSSLQPSTVSRTRRDSVNPSRDSHFSKKLRFLRNTIERPGTTSAQGEASHPIATR